MSAEEFAPLTPGERLDRIEKRLDRIEERHDRLDRHRRWGWLPYVVLALGMGIALFLVSQTASSGQLSAERRDRLEQDCQSRVEARNVLRDDVIIPAYTPPPGTPPERVQQFKERRDQVLRRVPRLKCETKAGIPIPQPVPTTTTSTSANGEPVA